MAIKTDPFYRALLQQAWAEGRDIQYGITHGLLHPDRLRPELVRAVGHLPWRHYHPEALSGGSIGTWLVRRTTHDATLRDQVAPGWYGAEFALQDLFGIPPSGQSTWLRVMAHWHLYSAYQACSTTFKTTDDLRRLVVAHPADCQMSRGEQWVLHHPADLLDWHPFHEGTGAMRRAPWWGLVSLVPNQAAERAYTDALWAYRGRAPLLGAAIAQTVSQAMRQPPSSSVAMMQSLMTAVHRLTLRHAPVRSLVATLWRRMQYGVAFEEQCQWIAHQAHFFPYDHVVPNLLVQLVVLGYGTGTWDSTLELLPRAGWDIVTNAIIVGTLLGLQGLSPVRRLEALESEIAATFRQLSV